MYARVYTQALTFEKRQYSLLGFDFGEGIERGLLVLGGLVVIAWFSLAALIFGSPTPHTFIFYFTAPAVFVYFGFQHSNVHPRRRRIAVWALWVRYALKGHRPFVAGRLRNDSFNVRSFQARWNLPQIYAQLQGAPSGGVWHEKENATPDTYTKQPPILWQHRLTVAIRMETPHD